MFRKMKPIEKGWSGDKKYYVETMDGKRMFYRVSDISELERKRKEYNMMKLVYEHGILTPEPLGFGLCDDGKSCYSLSGWIEGDDGNKALPLMPESKQYELGLKAGEILRKIHDIPAPDNIEPWNIRFNRKVQGRIDFYNDNPIESELGDIIVQYLHDNKHVLNDRPQTFNHGDFNVCNMMITPDEQIGVIDYNSYHQSYGDPWWEFDVCMDGWGSEASPYFHSALIHGYFNGIPPSEFFNVLSYYLAYEALAAVCDTSVHNQGEPEVGIQHMKNIMRWLDNFNNPAPTWYIRNGG